MASREEIGARYGLPPRAVEGLRGESEAELEADAARAAALIGMFTPRDLNVEQPEPPEPPVEGVPPADKPFDSYSEAEWEAVHVNHQRTMRERAKAQRLEREAEEARRQAEEGKTDAQLHGDAIAAALRPAAKRAAHLDILRAVHGEGEE